MDPRTVGEDRDASKIDPSIQEQGGTRIGDCFGSVFFPHDATVEGFRSDGGVFVRMTDGSAGWMPDMSEDIGWFRIAAEDLPAYRRTMADAKRVMGAMSQRIVGKIMASLSEADGTNAPQLQAETRGRTPRILLNPGKPVSE